MNMRKVQKILSILMLVVMIISTISTVTLAASFNATDIRGTDDSGKSYLPDGTSDNIDTLGKRLVGILQAVGIVLSVVVLIIIGIKYMLGSAEEKAEYKKTLMPYVIGAALIFAASMFAQAAYDFFMGLGKK